MEKQIDNILRGGQFKMLLEKQLSDIREKYGLKRIELEILYYLSQCKGKNTSTDIHKYLKMNKGHISQAVDCLCKKNYLSAALDQEDRRYVHYTITDQADVIIQDITEKWARLHQRIFDGISREDLEKFRKISEKMKENMEKILNES